jgi:hypothetical protein
MSYFLTFCKHRFPGNTLTHSTNEDLLNIIAQNAMKKAINSFWYDKWTNEKQIKSTFEYLEIQQSPIETPHNILRSGQSNSVAWLFRFALNPGLNMESVGLFYMRCSPR